MPTPMCTNEPVRNDVGRNVFVSNLQSTTNLSMPNLQTNTSTPRIVNITNTTPSNMPTLVPINMTKVNMPTVNSPSTYVQPQNLSTVTNILSPNSTPVNMTKANLSTPPIVAVNTMAHRNSPNMSIQNLPTVDLSTSSLPTVVTDMSTANY